MSQIIGQGNQGNFVLQGQKLATDQGFKNVSKLWFDKCITIDQGIEKISNERTRQKDILCPIKEVDFRVSDGEFVVEMLDGMEYRPTEKALHDIAGWCDKTSISFVDRITSPAYNQNGTLAYHRDEKDAETLVNVLKNGKRRIDPTKKFLFRCYDDGTMRCMLSDIYAKIDNVWFLNVLKEVLPGGMLSHWRGNADNIYGNVLIPDSIRQEFDSEYGAMISIGNSEIGMRRCFQLPSLFRAICMNGNIWDQCKGKANSVVHRGKINLHDLRKEIIANINDQIPLSKAMIDKLLNTRTMETKGYSLKNIFAVLGKSYTLSKAELGATVNEFLTYENSNKNLFGIINSITRAGQQFSNERWYHLDKVGGELTYYSNNDWERVLNRSKTVTPKELESAFGI